MRSLVVSGMMGAVAGGFYARVLLVVTPDSVFGMLVSAQSVVVTLFGGVASVLGALIGAAILVPLAETLQAELGTYLPGIQGVVYGIAIIAIMLLSPDGLFWTIGDRWFRRAAPEGIPDLGPDRKSTRLNSSHEWTSYAVFCLKKKNKTHSRQNATLSSASRFQAIVFGFSR